MADNNSIFNAETVEFLSKKGLEDVWALAKAKFFIKDNGDTQKADTLIKLETIGDLDASNLNTGILRRTIGGLTNRWLLDNSEYIISATAVTDGTDNERGLSFTHVTGFNNNDVLQTASSLINASTLSSVLRLGTAAYLNVGVGANNIPQLDSNGKLLVSVFPDSILGQVTFGGTITGYIDSSTLAVTMSGIAKRQMESRKGYAPNTLDGKTIRIRTAAETVVSGTTYTFGKNDCEGMYFIVTSGMIATDEVTRSWDGKSWEVGDWCVSTKDTWEKVDNTDAVTGIKFLKNAIESDIELGNVVISCAKIGALDLFTTTKQTMLGDLEIGTSSSAKGLSAWGGVAAHGIGDLTSGGGGGGTSGVSIMRDWANYDGTDETQVLGSNLAKAMKDNVTSKGDATHPVYFNANGVAVAITSYAGNAATASALATARNITIGNKTLSFDGSANISFSLAEIGAQAVIADVSDSVNGYVSKVTQTGGRIGVTHASFAKPAVTLSATKMKITTDGGNSDEVTIPTWNQDTTGNADSATKDSDGNNIADKFTITSAALQSLQSQIDSIALRDAFDELKASVLSSDIISAQNIYGALHGNADIATKVGHALTFGSKTYDGSAAKTITLADLATLADGKYAINISGKADTAGAADKVAHALTVKKNSTTLYVFDGSAARTLELDYSLTVNGTEEEPTGFTLAIDGTEIDLVPLTETEIRNICI